MNKIIDYYQKSWRRNIMMFFILGLVGAMSFLLVYFFQGKDLKCCCNASAVSFAVTFGWASFSLLNHFGAFDTLAYGGTMFVRMFSFKQEKKYQDLVDYKNVKSAKRDYVFPFITYYAVSLVFLVCLIAFEIQIHTIMG